MQQKKTRITLALIFDHLTQLGERMDQMERSLRSDMAQMKEQLSDRINAVEVGLYRLEGKINQVEKSLSGRLEKIEKRLIRLEQKVVWVHSSLFSQIDTLDGRLDDIELEFLPKRVRALEQRFKRPPRVPARSTPGS